MVPMAAAAEVEPPCPNNEENCTIYTYGDEPVDGTRTTGDLDRTSAGRRGARERLIRVRTDFFPELYKSVEQL